MFPIFNQKTINDCDWHSWNLLSFQAQFRHLNYSVCLQEISICIQ